MFTCITLTGGGESSVKISRSWSTSTFVAERGKRGPEQGGSCDVKRRNSAVYDSYISSGPSSHPSLRDVDRQYDQAGSWLSGSKGGSSSMLQYLW